MRWLSSLLVLICAGPAAALPPTETGRGFVDGANHHLGDVSYLERFGHAPGDGHAEEALRMRTHLRYVRSWLGARPATLGSDPATSLWRAGWTARARRDRRA